MFPQCGEDVGPPDRAVGILEANLEHPARPTVRACAWPVPRRQAPSVMRTAGSSNLGPVYRGNRRANHAHDRPTNAQWSEVHWRRLLLCLPPLCWLRISVSCWCLLLPAGLQVGHACGCTVPAKHICARGSSTVSIDAACPFSNILRKSVLVTVSTPAAFCLLRHAPLVQLAKLSQHVPETQSGSLADEQ